MKWFIFFKKDKQGKWEPWLKVRAMYRRDAIDGIGRDIIFKLLGTNEWMCKEEICKDRKKEVLDDK